MAKHSAKTPPKPRNPIARDLKTPKYRPRILPSKKRGEHAVRPKPPDEE